MNKIKLTLYFLLISVFIAGCGDDDLENTNPSIIKISGSSMDFGAVDVNKESSVKSYQIAAAEVEGDILVETEAPFFISRSFNQNFGQSLTLSPTDFQGEAITIYVQFKPIGSAGERTGVITHTSPDRENIAAIQLSGRATVPVPQIEVNRASLTFMGAIIGEDSEVQSYLVTGANLTQEIIVSTDEPFSISKEEDGTFSEQLTISAEELNTAQSIPIYVKFSPMVEGDIAGEITHASGDFATIPSVVLTGNTAIVSTLQVLDNFDYTVGPLPSQDRTSDGAANAAMDGWLKVRPANKEIMVQGGSLTYAGYEHSGIGNSVLLDYDNPGSNSNIYAYNLEEQQDAAFVGSYYASFLFEVKSLPTGGFNRPVMFVDWNSNGTVKFLSALQVDFNSGSPKFGVMYEGAFQLTDITPEIGKTYLVVLKHIVTDTDTANSSNKAAVYIFENGQVPATEPATPAAIVNIDATGDEFFVKAISLVNDNNPEAAYIVDGLQVTKTWSELFE